MTTSSDTLLQSPFAVKVPEQLCPAGGDPHSGRFAAVRQRPRRRLPVPEVAQAPSSESQASFRLTLT